MIGTGLAMVLMAAAQTAVPAASAEDPATRDFYGPVVPAAPKPKVVTPPAVDPCKPTAAKDVNDDTREIVVCAPKMEGYRIDPDVLKAQRLKKKNKLRGPERLVDNSCASVGPMGCRGGAGINLVAAALTAATMLQKAAAGENVGEMFITDPQPDEYQLYLQSKHEREMKEAEQAAAAKAKAAASVASSSSAR